MNDQTPGRVVSLDALVFLLSPLHYVRRPRAPIGIVTSV